MSEPTTPIEVFCACAPPDEASYHELEKHLSLLRRQGSVATWHRRALAPGTDWAKAIDEHLGTASLNLLLDPPRLHRLRLLLRRRAEARQATPRAP